jgi:hypothetical protein
MENPTFRNEVVETESNVLTLPKPGDSKVSADDQEKTDAAARSDADAAAAATAVATGAQAAAASATTAKVINQDETDTESQPAAATAAAEVAVGAAVAASSARAAADEVLRSAKEAELVSLLDDLAEHPPTLSKKLSLGRGSAIGRLFALPRKLYDAKGSYSEYGQACYVAKLMKSSPQNTSAAEEILTDIEFSISRSSPISFVMKGLAMSVGLLILFLVVVTLVVSSTAIYSAIIARTQRADSIQQVLSGYVTLWSSPLVMAVLFGILGSVVSILQRLSDFEGSTQKSRQLIVMTGAMLPLVGGTFAAVTYALFASGIINFQFAGNAPQTIDPRFFWVIGFLSGFSERFTTGLLVRAEPLVAGSPRNTVPDVSAGK